MLVQGAVRVDQVNVGDLPLQLFEQFQGPALEQFLFALVVRPDGGAHVGVAGVVEHAEIVVPLRPHAVHDGQHFGGLVEQEARLELPAHLHAVVGGDLAALVPHGNDAVQPQLRVHARGLEEVGRFDRVHTDRLHIEIGGEGRVPKEGGHVRHGVFVEDRRPRLLEAPQVDGDAGEGEAVVGDFLLQLNPAGLGRVRHGRRVQAEAAEFHAVVPEVLQLVQHLVEVVGRDFLVEDVRPRPDGKTRLAHGEVPQKR